METQLDDVPSSSHLERVEEDIISDEEILIDNILEIGSPTMESTPVELTTQTSASKKVPKTSSPLATTSEKVSSFAEKLFQAQRNEMQQIKLNFEKEKFEKEFQLEREKFQSELKLKQQELNLKLTEIEKNEEIKKLEIEKNERIAKYELELKYKK